MKRCPYCAEEIQDSAVKCKHCGEMLTLRDTDTLDVSHTIGDQKSSPQYDTLDAAMTQGREATILAAQYRIVKKLGEGGMGIVYLAEDTEMGNRQVAIKVLPPLLSRNVRAVENLRKEAITAINLNHPNIIRLYGFHSDGDIKFLVMEYIDGHTLEDKIYENPSGKLNLDETIKISEQIASALDYAHSQNPPVIHRDLKSSNIMVDKQGHTKILDFGIAREMKDSYTRVTGKADTSGTLPYMSPEQVRGLKPSPSMDIYSLGVICYECLNGKVPFYTGELTYQIIHEKPGLIEDIPDYINDALQNVLAKDPETRPQSANQVIELLIQETEIVGSKNENAIEVGRPFKYVGRREFMSFNCAFCGGKGKHAIVLCDKNGNEVYVGEICALHAGVEIHKKEPVISQKELPIESKETKKLIFEVPESKEKQQPIKSKKGLWVALILIFAITIFIVTGIMSNKSRSVNTSQKSNSSNLRTNLTGVSPESTKTVKTVSQPNQGDIITDGLVAYYKLDGTSGNVLDSKGVNTGTNHGAIRGKKGIIKNCFEFKGGMIDCGNSRNINTPQISVSVLFKTSINNDYQILMGKFSNRSGVGWSIKLRNNGKIWFLIGNVQVSNEHLESTVKYSTNKWHHLVITYDSNKLATIYLDNIKSGSGTLTKTINAPSVNLQLGNDESTVIEHYEGFMDEVKIWDRALSNSEVSLLYNSYF
ncbi:MAG: protein kinase [Sedimentisphaerales bacterium]|nr:protein kinase [Sedimentisphaerales bacterium]